MQNNKPQQLDDHCLWAYETNEQEDMPVLPAPSDREWMDATRERYANRCLPLVIANQSGWIIQNPTAFRANWNGGDDDHDVEIDFLEKADDRILSLFGYGTLTFRIPYLFRTPPGVNLWVKGPSNWFLDGAQPLEGIVETDWLESTFTMNWKLTRSQHWVSFQQGDPICMIVPMPRGWLEQFEPQRAPLAINEELYHRYRAWSESRFAFSDALKRGDEDTVKQGWQKHYVLGLDQAKNQFSEHQTRLHIKPFRRDETRLA